MVDKNMLISDILSSNDPDIVVPILSESGMHCLGCVLAHGETLEQAANAHGIDVDELINKINSATK